MKKKFKKRILAFLLCFVILFTYTASTYEDSQAALFEGIIGAIAGSTVGTGVAIGLAVVGVAYTGYQIYEHRDQLAEAGETIANAYVGYVSKKVNGEVAKVKLAKDFITDLGNCAIDVGTEAWEQWKDFSYDLVNNNLTIADFDGRIFTGQLSDFPSVTSSSRPYFDQTRVYSNYTKYVNLAFAGVTAGIYNSANLDINLKDIHRVTVQFKDMSIPYVIYRSAQSSKFCLGIGTLSRDLCSFDTVYCIYNQLFKGGVNYFLADGYAFRDSNPTRVFQGSTEVFGINSTFKEFQNHIENYTSGLGLDNDVLLQGLAPKVYDIDNWGSDAWEQTKSDSKIDDYPTSKVGVTGIDNVTDIPDSVVDAIDNDKAWDVAPRTNVDNWESTKTLPRQIAVNDEISSTDLPGCKTIEQALAYARAHDIPLSKVLEAMGVKVGDVAKDIDYAASIGATMTQEGIKADEKVGTDKTVIKPFVPSASDKPVREYTMEGLDELFPFCVPFDVIRLVKFLDAKPETPCVKWNVPTLKNGKITKNEITIDLKKYDGVARTCRTMEFIAFCFGFVLIVRKLIRG